MFVFISGAVRSGKSTQAEEYATRLSATFLPGSSKTLVYLATARIADREMRERVARHRRQREKKGFLTLERPRDLSGIVPQIPANATVLLECLATLTANELFTDDGQMADRDAVLQKISAALDAIRRRAAHLILVSNDLFSDGRVYGETVEEYRRLLAKLHIRAAARADIAAECVAGCVVLHKNIVRSTFHASGCHTANQVLLQRYKQEDDRHAGDRQTRQ